MTNEPYGAAALLSLFVPGLGQLAKRQLGRAILIWALMGVPLGVVAAALVSPRSAQGIPLHILVLMVLMVAFTVGVWLWAVVDAYNAPAGRIPTGATVGTSRGVSTP